MASFMRNKRTKRVLVMLNQTLKAARDEISGILRATSSLPDIEIRIFDRNLTPSNLRKKFHSWIPDGIITDNRGAVPAILPGGTSNHITFRLDQTYRIPVVYLDFQNPKATSVMVDDSAIGRTAADFFLRRKYRNFAFVGTNLIHTARHSQARSSAFVGEIVRSGHTCSCFEIDEQDAAKWSSELERLRDWIAALPKPCAVLAHADVYARLVTDACRLARSDIPGQIALLGVDNETDIADNLRPALSSILPDFEQAGSIALGVLDRLMRRKSSSKPRQTLYGVKALIERGSTQDAHGARRLVDAACGIVRARAHDGIRVSEIARELNVSPRLLELHFRAILGHSVRDQLTGYRLAEVQRRLVRTADPIESIALQCGWRSSTALKLLFRKRFGMSMRDFRKKSRAFPLVDDEGLEPPTLTV